MDRHNTSETQMKMEDLYVYALLCAVGYDEFQNYRCVLEDLFVNDPNNDELLDLMGRAYKDAILHTLYLMNAHLVDQDAFGSCLMDSLQPIYETEDLQVFGRHMYKLWTNLPDNLKDVDPFIILSYADDCLDYGDEKQCRELYEKALNYYKDLPNDTTVFHDINDLYKKIKSEGFRGTLERNGEWIWWNLPNGMTIKIAIQPNNFEGYLEVDYNTNDLPKSNPYVKLLNGATILSGNGNNHGVIPITHWHPADDELYSDLLSINNGDTFLVKGKYFLKHKYYVTSTKRWERKCKRWGWLFEKVQ